MPVPFILHTFVRRPACLQVEAGGVADDAEVDRVVVVGTSDGGGGGAVGKARVVVPRVEDQATLFDRQVAAVDLEAAP